MESEEPHAPRSDAAIDRFDEFAAAVRSRLIAGKKTFGDRSFERPASELIREMEMECLDICGWGQILHERLRDMRSELERARLENAE